MEPLLHVKANNFSTIQKTFPYFMESEVLLQCKQSPSLVSVLSWMNTVYNLPFQFLISILI